MRECLFLGLFVGIETPEADALKAMRKNQNVAVPMMESIKTLNDYGLEVTSGIIIGLDTDSDDTETRLKDFIDISRIPMLTINLLQALPKTPLWDRLNAAGRLETDPGLESNVRFLRPYDEVVGMWRRCIAHANDPERLFARFRYQVDATYVNRKVTPAKGKLTWHNLRGGAVMAWRIVLYLLILSDFRKPFLRMVKHALKHGHVLAQRGGQPVYFNIPKATIRIDNPIAVTTNSKNKSTAQAFVKYLYSPAGQKLFAQSGYRPVLKVATKGYSFPVRPEQFTVDYLGGWTKIEKKFFDPNTGLMTKIEQGLGG